VVVLVVDVLVFDDFELPCDAARATPPPPSASTATAAMLARVRLERNTCDLLSGRGAFRR
jgi:hypothetical protein